jgi:DNA-binding LacI/PurR family transcriptional regulator
MVKMSDIAAHLGVSRLTVSAVLNNRMQEVGIGEETARRVREASVALGYHRNHLALAMKTGNNPVIGCLISTLKSEWTSRTVSGLLGRLHESAYLIKIEDVTGQDAQEAALTRFLEQRVTGIFCCNFNPDAAFARRLEQAAKVYNMPLVSSISRHDLSAWQINSDDRKGIRQVVDYLWNLGHRRMAFIGGDEGEAVRRAAFLEAMEERGLTVPEQRAFLSGWNDHSAEVGAARLLSLKRGRPTAILCANDRLGAIVLKLARRMGLSVPRDLSVTGYSNSLLSEITDPALTSVVQPFEEIGRKCGDAMLQLIERKKKSPRPGRKTDLVPTSLVIRDSTGPVGR